MNRLFALGIAAAFVLAGPAGAGKPLLHIEEKEPMIPPIDAAAHVKTETATFALG